MGEISNLCKALRPLLEAIISRPILAVTLFAAAQIVAWTAAPALSHSAPPLDVVESYLWGQEWVVGTFKHPNMPGWALEISRELTGAVGWPAYLVSQGFVAATYIAVFCLGREMMDERRALAGTLLLAGIFYFTWPTIEFNHNVAQMPFWAAVAWLVWRLRTRPQSLVWAVLGAVAAASLYAKLSSGLLLLVAGLWILGDPMLRRQLARPAPWIGLAVFIIAAAPLFLWLLRAHFGPLLYAAERSSGAGEGPLGFIFAQGLACLGLLALAAMAGLFGPRGDAHDEVLVPPPAVATAFLAVMTLAPMGITALAAAVAGAGLKSMWGSPMLGLAGLLTVALTSARVTSRSLGRLAIAVGVLLIALPAGYALDIRYESRFTGKPKRQNWPQVAIAARFDQIWRAKTGQPLKIVAGERWIAGLVALRPGPMPSILTDGDQKLSPWVTPGRLAQQGALLVWEQKTPNDPPPGGLVALKGAVPGGSERFSAPLFPDAQPLLIGYAFVPPG